MRECDGSAQVLGDLLALTTLLLRAAPDETEALVQLLGPLVRMVRVSPRLAVALGQAGLPALLVRLLHAPTALTALPLLQLLRSVYEHHPRPKVGAPALLVNARVCIVWPRSVPVTCIQTRHAVIFGEMYAISGLNKLERVEHMCTQFPGCLAEKSAPLQEFLARYTVQEELQRLVGSSTQAVLVRKQAQTLLDAFRMNTVF